MRLSRRAVVASLPAALAAPALAQTGGDAPLRIIVPFPPGGSYDVVACLLQPALAERLRRPVVIENRGGAGGNVGAEAVARAAPDGATVLLWGDGILSNAALHGRLPWDPLRDFAPVGMVAVSPVVLAARPGTPPLTDLLREARRTRRPVTFGTAGNGSPGHVAGALLGRLTETEVQHVPYRGGAPALTDLLAGQLDLASNPPPGVLPFIRAGRLVALAVAGSERVSLVADVPTVGETVPGFAVNSWYGVLAPARTPAPVVAALPEALLGAASDPPLLARMEAQGFERRALGPDALAAFMAAEAPRWWDMIALSEAVAE